MTDMLAAIMEAWPGTVAAPIGATPPLHEFTDLQRTALVSAGETGGAFLQRIGQTDLSRVSTEQWDGFVEAIVRGYFDRIRA